MARPHPKDEFELIARLVMRLPSRLETGANMCSVRDLDQRELGMRHTPFRLHGIRKRVHMPRCPNGTD